MQDVYFLAIAGLVFSKIDFRNKNTEIGQRKRAKEQRSCTQPSPARASNTNPKHTLPFLC